MEVQGTNSNGPGVTGSGSTYGVIGSSTGAYAGVVGQSTTTAPGLYGQNLSSGPGLLALGAMGELGAGFDGGPDAYATTLAGEYPQAAGIFIGPVTITGPLTLSTVATEVTFQAPTSFTPGSGVAIAASASDSDAIQGVTTSQQTYGINATNNSSFPCAAALASSANGHGFHGMNQSGAGNNAAPTRGCGVWGESGQGYGVYGASASSDGVFGTSTSGYGVYGASASSDGVFGTSVSGYGVYGKSTTSDGIFGTSASGAGVHGEATSSSGYGVSALNNSAWPCVAIYGSSINGHGVHGVNQSGAGVTPPAGCGVWGESEQGIGVFGASQSGNAGQFQGNVSVSGDHSVNGNVNVAGDVLLAGGDCAERFDVSASGAAEAGTVMVIGEDAALRPSDRAYDRKVAGVVSGAGAFRPGIVMDKRAGDEGRTTIALVGKVYCKVDANAGPISIGDLLTTSDTPGHAMSVGDPVKGFGAVIGKSLGSLQSGLGLLPILIALQ